MGEDAVGDRTSAKFALELLDTTIAIDQRPYRATGVYLGPNGDSSVLPLSRRFKRPEYKIIPLEEFCEFLNQQGYLQPSLETHSQS